jgi:ubiquinone/menaquinone biosynthesis C-methylase UbiE
MADRTDLVETHYTQGSLLARVFGYLVESGLDPDNLTCEDLFACDQMHGRGIAATREHVEHAVLSPGMRVLDVGCGIGGSARYIATACDCQVTGIDITGELIEVARELTRRCGLADRVAFQRASALDMPFEDAEFDHVWSHNVIMNIKDKVGLTREFARVLKPGGRYSCAEFMAGPKGEPHYPLPWASDASSSFLVTPETLREYLDSAGFAIVEQLDLGETNRAFFAAARERADRGDAPLAVNPQSFKPDQDFRERVQNSAKSAREGLLTEWLFVAEKANTKAR